MHLEEVARRAPDRSAIVMSDGERISFRELADRANRLANLFRARGIERGGVVAIFMENNARFLEAAWAAQQSGLYYTTINSHLTADEASYIAQDSGARMLISSAALADVAGAIVTDPACVRLMVDGVVPGFESYEEAVATHDAAPLPDACEGDFMLYSSGTTGRPKGIQRPLTFAPLGEGLAGAVPFLQGMGLVDGDVYLCPAPLYHSAPVAWSIASHRLGATVVVLERFDPVKALQVIADHRVTHAQMVPTMFVRMLKLDDEVRAAADLSSLRAVVHAAAPCPVEVKRQMIEWWGPIIYEYYSATEGLGATFITSEEWLAHPGSVGRAMMGTPHILDDAGVEVATGETGTVWFEGGNSFEYHNDPEKTASAMDDRGWATVGDVGYLDEEGYLYLTDRKTFMIISGGVNIYPQEAENVLITHPKVMDVAVIGVPNNDLGEEVKAVVQPINWEDASDELAQELIDYCQSQLATFKCPRSIDFDPALPRLDTGKLYKRALRERYWEGTRAI